MFARNASSSRAIPFKKAVQRIIEDPFIPKQWPVNEKGMQGFTVLGGVQQKRAVAKWLEARDAAIRFATDMASEVCEYCQGSGGSLFINREGDATCTHCGGDGLGLNVHKQLVNRLIEPWSWITVCVTGDWGAWSNYFALRCHKDAQPEIQEQAYMAQLAYFRSEPRVLLKGQWHTPYIRPEEYSEIEKWVEQQNTIRQKDGFVFPLSYLNTLIQISGGRAARTSYLTQEGTRDFAKDIELFERLRNHTPLHASPFEHVCEAMGNDLRYGAYTGWRAYRHTLPTEYVTDFKPNHPELLETPNVR